VKALRRGLVVVLAASAVAAWASRPREPAAHVVIGVEKGVDGRAVARGLGLRTVEWLPKLRAIEASGPPGRLSTLTPRSDPRIRYVEPVETAELAHVRDDPLTYEDNPATGAPWEWQFHAVGADGALSITHGDPSILVGVVDSGVTPVRDLSGKIAQTLWDPAVARSAVDTDGHGTFVSSILAARDDDGFGLAGFCGACRLAVYRASPLTDVQVAEGIGALTDAHVRIINLSVVLDRPAQDVIDALHYASANGVLVVAAAGNEGGTSIDFPASYVQQPGGVASAGLAVGASDRKGRRASFSNTGQQLSLLAPGTFDTGCKVGILGAIPALATDFAESGSCAVTMTQANAVRYAYASGTSFAAPEVAGTAALIWALRPSLSAAQVASILEQTATRPPGAGWSPSDGWGVLNARAAVESAAGRSVSDAVVLANLVVSHPRRAGARLVAAVEARWSDGGRVVAGATPSCRISVRGRAVPAAASAGAGIVRCRFTLPAGSAGSQVRGSVKVTASGARSATASFRFAVSRA
jgi:membrane-anchored mycosin MYCP